MLLQVRTVAEVPMDDSVGFVVTVLDETERAHSDLCQRSAVGGCLTVRE